MQSDKLYIIILICAFALLFPVSNASAQSTIKIQGIVSDGETGAPLYRANVVVEGTGFGASTDERGYFRIENVLEGTYPVTASYIGYTGQRIPNVRISKDLPVRLDFKLQSTVIEMNEIEVSASAGRPDSQSRISVIQRKEIARSNYQSAGEVLEHIPGVEIRNSGGLGGAQKISIRGSQSNQVLVLLDGVPLNDQLGGDADLSAIPAHIIEKIEVHKGGSSPQFGGGAIGGAVNIITRKNFDNQLQWNSAYGSNRYYNIEPNWSGRYKNFGFFISYNYMESDGDFPYSYRESGGNTIEENRMNADIMTRNLFLNMTYAQQGHTFTIHAQRLDSERGMPGKIDAWTAYARTLRKQNHLGAEYRKEFRTLDFEIKYSYADALSENSNLYPADAELRYRRYPTWHYRYSTRNNVLHTSLDYHPADWWSTALGYTGRLLHYKDENMMPSLQPPVNEAHDTSHGFFVHQKLTAQLPWRHSMLILTPALRYDEMNMDNGELTRFERQWSPGIGMTLSTGGTNHVFLQSHLARSFRPPTFADLFYQDARIEGKPDLLPEKSVNLDIGLGVEFRAWGRLTAELTHFQYAIEDLIIWRLGSFEVFRPFNEDADISGQEAALDFSFPNEFLSLGVGYTRLEPLIASKNVTTDGKMLPYRSRESLKAHLSLQYGGWHASLRYRSVGKRFVNEANTIALDPYQIVDLNLSWLLTIGRVECTWKLSFTNLFDEEYEIIRDMPLPLREWRVGLDIGL
ncbi:MAG: TonB-dependent receptor [candidate division KSB1 bacterium]|nr:TonB-dependent receptor [candidate division KSB1 bacterium]